MRARPVLWLAILVGTAAQGLAQPPAPRSGIEPSLLDRSVRPQDDLFRHVNGPWLAAARIPPDRVTYSAFIELADQAQADVRAIVEEAASAPRRKPGSAAQQIGDLYASLMDEARVEALGAAPLQAELGKIEAIRTARDFAMEAGYLASIAAGGPFGGSVAQDAGDPGQLVVEVTQGGTLLPDRDYYLRPEAAFAAIRREYQAYLARLFTLLGRPGAEKDAAAVLALETELARAQRSPGESREAAGARARFPLDRLSAEMPGFDWLAWARPQGIDRVAGVVLSPPSFFKSFAALVPRTPLVTWKAWLLARHVTASAPYLSHAFADLRFDFFGRVLTGQELPRTRWKRGVALVSSHLGDAVGRLYVERHFPSTARARAESLVANVVEAYEGAIKDAPWMTPGTKRRAVDKLRRLVTRTGYPDRWRDYRGLVIKPDDLMGNVRRAQLFENEYRMSRLGPADGRGEWLITPQTANAYYRPAANEIVVPAALLHPPLFDPEADDAVNYGAIGALVGHELTHAFDEGGRRFDGSGAVRDWWKPEDEQAFRKRARRLVEQFGACRVLDGVAVDGELTLRENVGDLAGLEVAWRAYRLSLLGRPSAVIDGLTGEQRFFIGWARVWRSTEREEFLRQTLYSNPHAPASCRANGPVANLAAFHEAFSLAPGDKLFRPPEDRVAIW